MIKSRLNLTIFIGSYNFVLSTVERERESNNWEINKVLGFFTAKLAFIGTLIAGTARLSPGSCVAISVITKWLNYIKFKFTLKGILRAVRKLLKYSQGTAILKPFLL